MDAEEWRKRYASNGVYGLFDLEQISRKYASPLEVTLSAFTETGQPEPSIPVPKQKSYTEKLNIILGTSYTMEMRSLCSVLEAYIIKGYDFGTAFGYLRPFWHEDLTDIENTLRTREAWDRQMRQDVLVNDKIISRWLPPRRVWDLFSNRVAPWWVAREYPWAISHAWMKEEDRVDAHTAINGYEWPVPMPRDANLDLIRIEMLNSGAQYAWLDVLCLRQVGGRREDLRAEEWKVDVPTIGRVYEESRRHVVCYLSGLGCPFSLKEKDLESDTCWFRRAWTMQEASEHMIIGGDTGDDRFIEKEMRMTVKNRLSLLEEGVGAVITPVFIVLSEMQKRVSTNPLDRVAGLSYLVCTDGITAYNATQSEEDAWNALVDEMRDPVRGHMFFLYPQPGNGNMFWRSSWEQAMGGVLPQQHLSGNYGDWHGSVLRTKAKDADRYDGPCIESGYVRGLFHGSLERNFREGELIVEDITGAKHTFKIVAYHQYPIPEGLYALVGSSPLLYPGVSHQRQCWVVGERLPGEVFKKLSVFQIPNEKDVKRLHELGVTTDTKTFPA